MNTRCRNLHIPLVLEALFLAGLSMLQATHAQPADRAYYWTQVSASAPWPTRTIHAALNFKNKIWVIGGFTYPNGLVNDVWSSPDGRTWTLEANALAWLNGRGKGRVVVFADKLWVVGNSISPNDTWNSPDGVRWSQVVPNTAWGSRADAEIILFKNRLWVLGGMDTASATDLNDVWSSSDGIQWIQDVEHTVWSPRSVNAVVFKEKLWVIGGCHYISSTGGETWFHDAVYSIDGISWIPVPAVGVGFHCALAEFDNQLWDIDRSSSYCGYYGCYIVVHNEVWRSQDAADWHQMPNAPWSARYGQATVAFDGKLWVLGGGHDDPNYTALNDVWNLTPVSLDINTGQRQLYALGDPMTLILTASALSGTVHYQWSKDGNSLPGATSDTYHVDAFTANDAGAYTCELTGDTFGSAGPVEIGVAPPKMPAASPAGLAFGVCLTAAVLIFRKRKSPYRGQ